MNNKQFSNPRPRLISLLMLALLFICCTDKKSKGRNQPIVKDTALKSVEIISAGGELGLYARMSIDKDSTHYKQTVAANPVNNSEYHKQTDPQNWKNLGTKINLTEFKSAKEGKSVQPVDGIDTQVIIVSNADTILKMNAYNNSVWKNVVEHGYHGRE